MNLERLNRRHLKIISSLTMFIDHIAAAITYNIDKVNVQNNVFQFIVDNNYIFRSIGRIAFPIYCFMFVNSWNKTSNKVKYMINLLIFSVISEPIYDKVFNYSTYPFTEGYNNQNIIFIFFFCSLYFYFCETVCKNADRLVKRKELIIYGGILPILIYVIRKSGVDYGINGAIPILTYYFLNNKKFLQKLSTLFTFLFETIIFPSTLLATPIILMYNDKSVKFNKIEKYCYYIFYPLHLFVIGLIVGVIF